VCMCALPLGVAAEQSVHYLGLSRVCALPLGVAAEQSVHYRAFLAGKVGLISKNIPEGLFIGFQNFVWAPK
jgi:hypothetical protein